MSSKSNPIIKDCKDHYTQTTFEIDFKRFNQKEKGLNSDFITIMHKRCIDAAAANLGLKIIVNIKSKEGNQTYKWKFKKFEEYMELYSDFIDVSSKLKPSNI